VTGEFLARRPRTTNPHTAPSPGEIMEAVRALRTASDSLGTDASPLHNGAVIRRGGNSTVTRLTLGDSTYAVKDYSQRSDGQQRMAREFTALGFVHPRLPGSFARPVAMSPHDRLAVHTWLEGTPAPLDEVTVDGLLGILADVDRIGADPWAAHLPQATDAVLSIRDIESQVVTRLGALASSHSESVRDTAVAAIRQRPLLPSPDTSGSSGVGPAHPRTLSLSDAGAHNLLRTPTGIACVDLEFFGWDDPHKLVCDALLHPLARWTRPLAEQFLAGAEDLYGLAEARLLAFYPWLAAKWIAIVLTRMERLQGLPAMDPVAERASKADLSRLMSIISDPPVSRTDLLRSVVRPIEAGQ